MKLTIIFQGPASSDPLRFSPAQVEHRTTFSEHELGRYAIQHAAALWCGEARIVDEVGSVLDVATLEAIVAEFSEHKPLTPEEKTARHERNEKQFRRILAENYDPGAGVPKLRPGQKRAEPQALPSRFGGAPINDVVNALTPEKA